MMSFNLKVISLLAILWQWILLENSSIVAAVAAVYKKAGVQNTCQIYQGQCLEKGQIKNILELFMWHMNCKNIQEKILRGNVIIEKKTIEIFKIMAQL